MAKDNPGKKLAKKPRKSAGKKAKKPKRRARAARPELTPERVDRIVIDNTPDAPSGDVDPDTQLVDLGVVSDDLAADLQAGVQSDLNHIGWHIRQDDITSTPSTSVSRCRTSVIKHAF